MFAIDFGRFDLRPPHTELCRLAALFWLEHPEVEEAFLSGYGYDPREPEAWRIQNCGKQSRPRAGHTQSAMRTSKRRGQGMVARALEHF